MKIPTPTDIDNRLIQQAQMHYERFRKEIEQTFLAWNGQSTVRMEIPASLTDGHVDTIVQALRNAGWEIKYNRPALYITRPPSKA